jgi:hypothetical protein
VTNEWGAAMSKTPEEPLPIRDRVRELEASRRRHMWVLILPVLTTCGYVDGRTTDIGQDNRVERLNNDVRRLSDEVSRLRDEVEDANDEGQRADADGSN